LLFTVCDSPYCRVVQRNALQASNVLWLFYPRPQDSTENQADDGANKEAEEAKEEEAEPEAPQVDPSDEAVDDAVAGDQDDESSSSSTSNEPELQDNSNDMPEWYHWEWKETILPRSRNTPMNIVTMEVLLYGPTSIDQLSIHVVGPKRVRIDFVPHSVFYNARRTALHTRSDLSSHRIMMQEEAVNAILAENDYQPLNRVWCFDLGVEVDPNFTTRDDNGNEGVSEPVTISEFIHDDLQFQADGKTVWILAIETTAARRTQAGPSRAQGLDFSAFDPDRPQSGLSTTAATIIRPSCWCRTATGRPWGPNSCSWREPERGFCWCSWWRLVAACCWCSW
jgi:hypothetical protein